MKKIRILAFILIMSLVSAASCVLALADDLYVFTDEGEIDEYVSDVEMLPDEELFGDYVDMVMYGGAQTVSLDDYYIARDYLSDYSQVLYDLLKEKITAVANGELSSTVFSFYPADFGIVDEFYSAQDLGVDTLFLSNGTLNPVAKEVLNELYDIDKYKVIDALLMDCPFELYWYDKVSTTSLGSFSIARKSVDGVVKIGYATNYSMSFTLPVSVDYADSSKPKDSKGRYVSTDSLNLSRVGTAREHAQKIIEHFDRYSDYSKLSVYADMVNDLSEYDYQAAAEDREYGDPWQLIYVFDGDPDTKVVCEGYSKAFKYLCDLSDFEGNVGCTIAEGIFYSSRVSGAHMWDIVSLNGLNRIVDITNFRGGKMFMPVPLEGGSVFFGYSFDMGDQVYKYTYDEDLNFIGWEMLTLTDEELEIDFDKECTDADHIIECEEGYPADCYNKGLSDKLYCSFCGEVLQEHQVIEPLGHEEVIDEEILPGCNQEGLTEGSHCARCDEILKEQTAIPALEHKYVEKVTKEPSYTEKGINTFECENCNDSYDEEIATLQIDVPDGLADKAAPDGSWYYVKDKRVDVLYSGSAANKYGTWFIEEGKVDFSLSGLHGGNDGIWYVKEGKIQTEKTDVLYSSYEGEYGWFNIINGQLIREETVANNSSGWWYIGEDGRVNFDYKGFAANPYGIWYLEGGKVSFNKTDVLFGTVGQEEGWWNVVGSQLIKKETVAGNSNGWWYIGNDGKVDFDYKGFAANSNGIWYLENGKVSFNKTDVLFGTVGQEEGWWNVVGSKIEKKVTVAHNSNGWWYIGKDGKVDFNFTGIASNSNGSWYIEGGKVNFAYNGRVNYGGRLYLISGGKVS